MPQFVEFGPDVPLSIIQQEDPGFYTCLMKSIAQDADPTKKIDMSQCDITMSTFCDLPKYEHMSYCACLNSTTSNALCAFAPCANSAVSYKPRSQRELVKAGQCPTMLSCSAIQKLGGTQNVMSHITQEQDCSSNEIKVYKNVKYSVPKLFLIFLVIVLLISTTAMLVALYRDAPSVKPHPKA